MATCPECEFDEIETADYEEGDTFSCPECGKNLMMLAADEVEIAADEDEDLDDDDDEDEDEDEDDVDDEDDIDDDEEAVDEDVDE
jgi:hypothetical protein